MKSFRVALAVIFIVAFAMIACEEDATEPVDSGGVPPEDTNASNVCSRELCATNEALKQECQIFLAACLAESLGEEECVGAAWVICNG